MFNRNDLAVGLVNGLVDHAKTTTCKRRRLAECNAETLSLTLTAQLLHHLVMT